jgi:N-methylhydantoinase A/oxoprolinase/acetone carboxylase beta subunit
MHAVGGSVALADGLAQLATEVGDECLGSRPGPAQFRLVVVCDGALALDLRLQLGHLSPGGSQLSGWRQRGRV